MGCNDHDGISDMDGIISAWNNVAAISADKADKQIIFQLQILKWNIGNFRIYQPRG